MDTIYVLSDRLRHVLNALERVEETHVELLVGNDLAPRARARYEAELSALGELDAHMVSYLSVSAIWLPNWELVASGEKVVVLYPHFFMRRGVRTEAAINCGLIQKPTNVIELKLPYPLKVYPPQARSSGVWLWRKEWLEVAIDLDVK